MLKNADDAVPTAKALLAVPSIALAIVGSHFGTRLQHMMNEQYLRYILIAVLAIAAWVMLKKKVFSEEKGDMELWKRCGIVWAASLLRRERCWCPWG